MITRRLIISPPPQLLIITISLLLRCILLLHLPSPAHCASSSSSSSSGSSSSSHAAGSGGGTYGGRHSYSLSTFSPSGGIDQVVRATRASMLGSPIVAMSVPRRCWSGAGGGDDDGGAEEEDADPPPEMEEKEEEEEGEGSPSSPPASATGSGGDPRRRRRRRRPVPPGGGGIYLAMPLAHLASSPLIVDDGTPRIVRITSSVIAIHSGVGADGRALCDAASRLAAEHERAHGEEARPGDLLAGISEMVREVTMRAGSRPYGCALLVGCLGEDDGGRESENDDDDDAGGGGVPTMYRVDPSGAVVLLNPPVAAGDRGGGGGGGVGNRQGGVSSSPAVAFLGNWDAASGPPSHRRQTATTMDEARRTLEGRKYATEDEVRDALMNVAKRTFVVGGSSSSSSSSTGGDGGGEEDSLDPAATAGRGGRIIGGSTRTEEKRPMLYASFTRERGLRVSRINI